MGGVCLKAQVMEGERRGRPRSSRSVGKCRNLHSTALVTGCVHAHVHVGACTRGGKPNTDAEEKRRGIGDRAAQSDTSYYGIPGHMMMEPGARVGDVLGWCIKAALDASCRPLATPAPVWRHP